MTASKWLAWQPEARINRDAPSIAPTKPSKPGSVGFEGALVGDSRFVRPNCKGSGAASYPTAAKRNVPAAPVGESATGEGDTLQSALRLLNERGCRSMNFNGQRVIGCWPELDDRDFQEALKLVKMDHLPVRWLGGPTIPEKYRTCSPQVQRLRKARQPVPWEKWVLSRPISSLGGSG